MITCATSEFMSSNRPEVGARTLWVRLVVIMVASLCVASCSSGESSPTDTPAATTTGRFIDDPVQGLSYDCSSGSSGVTNGNGEYVCNAGDDVTFSLGAIVVGTVAVQEDPITPYSFFPSDIEAAINLAKLLQAIDADGMPGNGVIVIDDGLVASLPRDTDFSSATFEADVEGALGLELPSREEAEARLNEAILEAGGRIPEVNSAPVAEAGPDRAATTGSPVTLDGSGSSDADGDMLSYAWTLLSVPTGSSATLTGASTVDPELVPDLDGTYVIELEVSDGVASDTDTVTVVSESGSTGTEREWIVETGTTLYDHANDIALDSAGNVYITGHTRGSLDGSPSSGYEDVIIVKYDADGSRLWTRQVVGTGDPSNSGDRGLSIAVDDPRNVLYVTGWTTGDLHGQPNSGQQDFFIMKYSLDGVRLWTVVDGTSNTDLAYGVAVDTVGDVFVTGMTEGELHGNTSHGGRDIFISKYSAAGAHLWTAQPGTENYEYGYGIAVGPADHVYVVGYSADSLDGSTHLGLTDIIATKYNGNGVRRWTRQLGTPQSDIGKAIALDAVGNVYLTGDTNGTVGSTSQGDWDAFIVKLNIDGVPQWAEQLGTDEADWGYGIALDAAGNVHISGYTNGTLSDNVSQGASDYFIAKLDNDGRLSWAIQDGREFEDWSTAVEIDSANNLYATGVTHALLPNRASSSDIFVARYGDQTMTSDLYTVGGTVTGIVGTFTLTNNGGDEITIDANGPFVFPTGLPDGAAYRVEISGYEDGGHMCVVSGGHDGDGTGRIQGADVTNILVTCYPV